MAFKISELFKKFSGEGVIPLDSLGDRRLGPPHLLRSYRLQGRHHAPGATNVVVIVLVRGVVVIIFSKY